MVKKFLSIFILIIFFVLIVQYVFADALLDKGINYLKLHQDTSGKITGFGGESEWAAIAFAANGIDISAIKNPSNSLKDFLLNDIPTNTAKSTDWERKILAIAAIGSDPTNFNGINYLQELESFYNKNQIGDVNLLNDDIFGLLAEIAGKSANLELEQNVLNFIISHQNSDGGFSYSTISPSNSSDSNDTASAIQALVSAKNNSLTATNLDTVITNAKNYLLTTQKNDGGFGYDVSSDADGSSTAWALQALNLLGLESSVESTKAKSWLLNNQETDGGFHWQAGLGSDTYTTSHALIALEGKGLILNLNTASASASPATIVTPSATLLVTPSPMPSSTLSPTASSTPIPTHSPTHTPTPTPVPTSSPTATPTPISTPISTPIPSIMPTPTPEIVYVYVATPSKTKASPIPLPSPEVLGVKKEPEYVQKVAPFNLKRIFFSAISLLNFAGAALFWRFKL